MNRNACSFPPRRSGCDCCNHRIQKKFWPSPATPNITQTTTTTTRDACCCTKTTTTTTKKESTRTTIDKQHNNHNQKRGTIQLKAGNVETTTSNTNNTPTTTTTTIDTTNNNNHNHLNTTSNTNNNIPKSSFSNSRSNHNHTNSQQYIMSSCCKAKIYLCRGEQPVWIKDSEHSSASCMSNGVPKSIKVVQMLDHHHINRNSKKSKDSEHNNSSAYCSSCHSTDIHNQSHHNIQGYEFGDETEFDLDDDDFSLCLDETFRVQERVQSSKNMSCETIDSDHRPVRPLRRGSLEWTTTTTTAANTPSSNNTINNNFHMSESCLQLRQQQQQHPCQTSGMTSGVIAACPPPPVSLSVDSSPPSYPHRRVSLGSRDNSEHSSSKCCRNTSNNNNNSTINIATMGQPQQRGVGGSRHNSPNNSTLQQQHQLQKIQEIRSAEVGVAESSLTILKEQGDKQRQRPSSSLDKLLFSTLQEKQQSCDVQQNLGESIQTFVDLPPHPPARRSSLTDSQHQVATAAASGGTAPRRLQLPFDNRQQPIHLTSSSK